MRSTTDAVRGRVHRASLSGQVARLIGDYLEDNHLTPGDPLPAAKELAERFDVSVPVVREAIAELAGQGRLQRSQGRPTIARAPSAVDLQAVLRSAAAAADDRDRQLLQLRRALQVGAVRTVTLRSVVSDVIDLRADLVGWEALPPTPEQLRRASVTLHRNIAALTGNDLTLLTLEAVDGLLMELDTAVWRGRLETVDPVPHVIDELGSVLAAMSAGKPRRAERLLHDHLDQQDHFVAAG